MQYLFNITIYLALYLSVPFAIRFILLRRAMNRKWVAICILIPLFIMFSLFLNVQRDHARKQLAQEYGIPYKSRPHMIGSPVLYLPTALSYIILRKGHKNPAMVRKEPLELEQPKTFDSTTSS